MLKAPSNSLASRTLDSCQGRIIHGYGAETCYAKTSYQLPSHSRVGLRCSGDDRPQGPCPPCPRGDVPRGPSPRGRWPPESPNAVIVYIGHESNAGTCLFSHGIVTDSQMAHLMFCQVLPWGNYFGDIIFGLVGPHIMRLKHLTSTLTRVDTIKVVTLKA